MTEESSERRFADRALKRLPVQMPRPGFETVLLAAYDTWNVRRPAGRWTALKGALCQFSHSVWPGAPVWAPAFALVVALLAGAGLGIILPPILAGGQPAFSLEQPASFSLLSANMAQENL